MDLHNNTAWQRNTEQQILSRNVMNRLLYAFLHRKYAHKREADKMRAVETGLPNNQIDMKPEDIPHLAKSIEFLLYTRAYSFDEYKNKLTLGRRLRFYIGYRICTGYNYIKQSNASTSLGRTKIGVPESKKRKVLETEKGEEKFSYKRFRIIRDPKITANITRSSFILGNGLHLHMEIFKYFEATEIFPLFVVSHLAKQILLQCVRTVVLSKCHFSMLSKTHYISQLENLEKLEIYNYDQITRLPEGLINPNSTNPVEVQISDSKSRDEKMMKSVCSLLHCTPKLRVLCLNGIFINPLLFLSNELASVIKSGALSKLEVLDLQRNNMGDRGAAGIARGLSSNSCPMLRVLNLDSNYIGEMGFRSCCNSLISACSDLRALHARNNILTDGCLLYILEILKANSWRSLKFLDMDGNFYGNILLVEQLRAFLIVNV